MVDIRGLITWQWVAVGVETGYFSSTHQSLLLASEDVDLTGG